MIFGLCKTGELLIMKKLNLLVLIFLSFSILRPQVKSYLSNKYGFSINFPDEVEVGGVDKYSHSFSSFELVGEFFIMYQVQVLDERPNAHLKFKTREEYHAFLLNFLESFTFLYDERIDINKSIFIFDKKYYALDYEFKGVWTTFDLPVYNKGIVILHNSRLTKISFIYHQELHNNPAINTKYKNYVDSFLLIE